MTWATRLSIVLFFGGLLAILYGVSTGSEDAAAIGLFVAVPGFMLRMRS